MSRATKRAGVAGSWVLVRKDQAESPAWRAASDDVRRLLDRIQLEHMRHGGRENGNLAVTYDDFAKAGLRRRGDVSRAIREAVALGFLEVTRQGGKSSGGFKFPSTYRLTYVFGKHPGATTPTDEWAAVETDAQAQERLAAAEAEAEARNRKRVAAKAMPKIGSDMVKVAVG